MPAVFDGLTLADVVTFYDQRFKIGFTEQEKEDLAAFLASPGSPGEFLPPREEASSVASTTDTQASLAFLPPLRP